MAADDPVEAWQLDTGSSRSSDVIVFSAPAAREDGALRERLAASARSARAIAWIPPATAATRPPAVHVLALDGDGRLAEPVELPGGLRLPAGTAVDTTAGGEPPRDGVHVALEGPAAGLLRLQARGALDPWIRYAYPAPPTSAATVPFAGFAFRIFPASVTARLQLDPARPLDPARTFARPAEDPVASCFRTRWGATVTLAGLSESLYVQAYDPARDETYWTLDGPWTWGVADVGGLLTTGELELMPGLSGAEYVRAPSGYRVRFVAGAPAYAPAFDAIGPTIPAPAAAAPPLALVSDVPGLAVPVQTAWIYPEPAPLGEDAAAGARFTAAPGAEAAYHSQPDRAGLFTTGAGEFLDAFALAAAPLPAGAGSPYAPSASFPAAPWSGLDGGPGNALERRFEQELLAAARGQAIASLTPPVGAGASPTPTAPRADADSATTATAAPSARPAVPSARPAVPPTTAVTPQGLLSTFSDAAGATWERLVLAQARKGTQQLALTEVRGKLREALLANRLFLVVSDVERLLAHCSIPYCVTDRVLRLALAQQSPPLPREAVKLAAEQLLDVAFPTRAAFDAALRRVLGSWYAPVAGPFFLRWSEQAQLEIAGWTFDLSSWRWADSAAPTMLVIKFADDDLATLIDDRSRWTMAGEFNAGDGAAAQARLRAIAADAAQRLPTEPELAYFVGTVLGEGTGAGRGSWNGVLVLDPVVPTTTLPPDLAALAAGLPTGDVRAHHLGVTLSSFALRGRAIALEDSSLFGLILYADGGDLVYRGDAYDFKVLSLRVRFANSAIASFASQVELLVGQLFNELSSLPGSLRGDNLVFDGTLQRGAYRFTTTTLSHFEIASRTLAFVEVANAVFVTVTGESNAQRTVARFLLDGTIGFRPLSDDVDLFGYGPGAAGLACSGLFVSMEFDPAAPQTTRSLEFVAGQATFDLARSGAREGSLPRRFPLVPAALRQSERSADRFGRERAATPADLGFITVEAPNADGALGDVWYGIELALSFGSPGALAPQLAFTGALLLAWAPDARGANVAVGLRLPGAQGGSRALTIMGPLKLTIGRLSLLRDESADGYLLRMANVALSFLGVSFPSGGKANALLFGDPDPRAANSALGWYAAYRKDDVRSDDRRRPTGALPCRTE